MVLDRLNSDTVLDVDAIYRALSRARHSNLRRRLTLLYQCVGVHQHVAKAKLQAARAALVFRQWRNEWPHGAVGTPVRRAMRQRVERAQASARANFERVGIKALRDPEFSISRGALFGCRQRG